MIDFHSHILPGIDDGARNVEETFELIQEAEKAGFDRIISTSHYIEGHYESDVEERKKWLNGLKYGIENLNVDVKLYLGNEVYFTENIIDLLEDNKITTINNSRYLLFEFPLNEKPFNIYDVIYTMMEHKIVPILAHPERYSFIQKNPNMVYEFVQNGVLMQSNYGSIIGEYGEKAKLIVRKLLENNLVHFLGSDVHRKKSIYPKIPDIVGEILEMIGERKAYELTTLNPKQVLKNEKIEISDPSEMKFTFKEKRILSI